MDRPRQRGAIVDQGRAGGKRPGIGPASVAGRDALGNAGKYRVLESGRPEERGTLTEGDAERVESDPELAWRVLGILNIHRLLIPSLLAAAVGLGLRPAPFGGFEPEGFRLALGAWFLAGVVFIGLLALLLVGPGRGRALFHDGQKPGARPLVHRDLKAIEQDTLRVLVMRDPIVLIKALLGSLTCSVISSALPARKAARMEIVEALRHS